MAAIDKYARRYRGAAIIEAAIVLPVLLLVTFGIIEYGWLFLKLQQITSAAREGARAEARYDSAPNAGFDAAKYVLTKAGISVDPVVSYTIVGGQPAVMVTVTVDTEKIPMLHIYTLLPMPPTIRGQVTMAKEGP